MITLEEVDTMWLRALKERVAMYIVWHMLPRTIVMWAFVRVAAHATQGQYSETVVPELTAMDALARWEKCDG